ncbi:hypothetical protein PInf_003237 [Phytophthora infestans]|nr:hypothetical protein PInf_003237 [Phytophthora infestans]
MDSLWSVGNSPALPQSPLVGDDCKQEDCGVNIYCLDCNQALFSLEKEEGRTLSKEKFEVPLVLPPLLEMANSTTGTPLKNTKIAASAPPGNNATSAFKQKNGKADFFTRFIENKKTLDTGSVSLNEKKKKRQKKDLFRGAKTAVMKAIAAKDTADALETIGRPLTTKLQPLRRSSALKKAAATKAAVAKMANAAMKAAAVDAKQAASTTAAEANAAKAAAEAEGAYADLDTKDAAADGGSSDDKRKSKSKNRNKHRKHKKRSSEKDKKGKKHKKEKHPKSFASDERLSYASTEFDYENKPPASICKPPQASVSGLNKASMDGNEASMDRNEASMGSFETMMASTSPMSYFEDVEKK